MRSRTHRTDRIYRSNQATCARSVTRSLATVLTCLWGLAIASSASAAGDPFLRRTPTVLAAQNVGPAVVNIVAEHQVVQTNPFPNAAGNPLFESFFRDFLPPQRSRTVQNLGSGVIINNERHMLTNAHVVLTASKVRAILADGREFPTTLIGADVANDLAVLQIETDEPLPWVAMGTSNDLMVGEPVIAIGNPYGFSNTVTTGVISALDRSVRGSDGHFFHGFLQTDASINPGNSGGPLVNAEGTLIAINTAVYNGAQGIGFAIPIDVAVRVVAQLVEHGEVMPVWLGLQFQSLEPALREVMFLPDSVTGVLVNGVQKDGPGDAAGIQRGDVVSAFEGRPLTSAERFFEMLRLVVPGQLMHLEIWRDGKKLQIETNAVELPADIVPKLAESLLGIRLEPRLGGGFEIMGVRPNSTAAQIGIRTGDLLVGLSGQPLHNEANLRRTVASLRGQTRAVAVVQRGDRQYPVSLSIQ
jgi:serine protease Do